MKPRHEQKYIINRGDYLEARERFCAVLQRDDFADKRGEYTVRSLYFDNYNDKALMEKIDGVSRREKFRIRFYNGNLSAIKLEKKMKENDLCYKLTCTIDKQECETVLAGRAGEIEEQGRPLMGEFKRKIINEFLRPAVVIDYTREAYVYPAGNVRVTFDKYMRTGVKSVNLFDEGLPTIPSMDPRLMVLEVKFDEFLPGIVADLLKPIGRFRGAVSKYTLCRIYGW